MAKQLVSYCGRSLEDIKEEFYHKAMSIFLKSADIDMFSDYENTDAEIYHYYSYDKCSLALQLKIWNRKNNWTWTEEIHDI